MPSGLQTKETISNGNSQNSLNEPKKKRQRIRNRVRNKNYKPPAATTDQGIQPGFRTARVDPKANIKPAIATSAKSKNTFNCEQPQSPSQHNQHDQKAVIEMESAAPSSKPPSSKSREQIMAEREAKKLAKQAKKANTEGDATPKIAAATPNAAPPQIAASLHTTAKELSAPGSDKTREQIKAEREAKKLAKQAVKVAKSGSVAELTQDIANLRITEGVPKLPAQVSAVAVAEEKKKLALTKAERRAIQEAQRAAKSQKINAPSKTTGKTIVTVESAVAPLTAAAQEGRKASPTRSNKSPAKAPPKSNDCKAKLFSHLQSARKDVSLFVNDGQIHPSIARLGEQYAKRTIVGSNARCIAFLSALKMVIQDFETPPKKEFARSLESFIKNCVDHLQKCRPLAVSVCNAYKHIKHMLTQLPTDQPESELKENLCHFIDTYVENQIGKAAQAISSSLQEKITNGDVILTFGCSSLINYICEEAQRRHVDFRVIVVDSRPFCEGQELLRRLTAKEIPCTYVLINAVGFVMPEATKVLLGAHALLSNGYVMARTGTAQVALVARSFNVPVLVCCETHKFSERFQTDAIVYNELGNPDELIISDKCCLTNWQAKSQMSPLNLIYDITPPELVTAVVTEVSILPCTSVPVILRIKPTEIGYYS